MVSTKMAAWVRLGRTTRRRSGQKSRLLPAETKAMSEKWPQAIFLIN